MITSQSPRSAIKAQSDMIAKLLKAVERGERPIEDIGGKIAASLASGKVKAGIVMDDKLVTLEMPWIMIKATSEVGLSEMIGRYMRGGKLDG